MIPLALVTGFLGSGKTTLLQRIARSSHGKNVLFLVNEFGELNIDCARVAEEDVKVFEVNGGSLFCECKVGDFLANLKRIKAVFEGSNRPLRGALIETSGIADPTVMTKLLQETGFASDFRIARIIAIVSPVRFEQYLQAYPNITAQIRASDSVLLNKIDLAREDELAKIEASIRALNPTASLQRTRFSHADLDLWSEPSSDREATGHLTASPNPYATVSVTLRSSVTAKSLQTFCQKNANVLLRVKGQLQTPTGTVQIDYANGQFSAHPKPNSTATPHLTLIVDEANEDWAQQTVKATGHLFKSREPLS